MLQGQLRRQHKQLEGARAAKEVRLQEQRARCRDVQLLKFGHEIDVRLLEMVGVRNYAADELRAALKQQVRVGGAGGGGAGADQDVWAGGESGAQCADRGDGQRRVG